MRIRYDAYVAQVRVVTGRAAGVRLRTGEELPARNVVTTVSARQREPARARLAACPARPRLRIWRYSTAAFKLDYALRRPVPWSAEGARRAAVVHVGGELRDLSAAAEAARHSEVPGAPALVVGQHTSFDASRAPEGQHTL